MDVRLSAEQQALRDSVAAVVRDLAPRTVADLDDRERAAKLDAAVAAAGWRELRTADDAGALWASGVEVAIIAEQLGRGLADAPFVGPTIAAELRRLAGAPAASERETVLLCGDLAALASPGDSGALAVDAADAHHALALTPAKGAWSLSEAQLRASSCPVDLTRPVAPATGDAAVVASGALVDENLTRVQALGLTTACADLVGTMQGALDLAVGYATERKQYGQPVGAFQAVQHLLADALVAVEGSRSATLHAAWAVDALPPADALVAASVAKAYTARASRAVCETAIQVHGGIGNTWECLAHVHLRRALLSADLFGGLDACLRRVYTHHVAGDDGLR